jgi:hypothetical protein
LHDSSKLRRTTQVSAIRPFGPIRLGDGWRILKLSVLTVGRNTAQRIGGHQMPVARDTRTDLTHDDAEVLTDESQTVFDKLMVAVVLVGTATVAIACVGFLVLLFLL